MEQSSAQTIATFTGTLLKREHTLGEKFVQLVFREGSKNWLCISTDPTNAKWDVGQSYHIEGEFKKLGARTYIHEPKISPLKVHRKKLLWISAAGAILILAIGGVAFGLHGHAKPIAASNVSNTEVQRPATDNSGSSNTSPSTTNTPPAASAPTTTPAVTTTPTTTHTTKKSTKPTTTTSSSSSNSNSAPQTPASTPATSNSSDDTSTDTTSDTPPPPDSAPGDTGASDNSGSDQTDTGQTQDSGTTDTAI